MTESARREPIVDSGLKGHNCCRLSRRRSDLFHHHALCVVQLLVRGAIRRECLLQAALWIRAKGRCWCQTAQMIRASLLATATAALLCT
jgi:hypothetical protein